MIPDSRYNAAKENYDIRLKEWAGSEKTTGEGTIHISGQKRDAIKSFLEERRYVTTPEFYHYVLRARGKKVDPAPISLKIRQLGFKFLWVRVIGESDPGRMQGTVESSVIFLLRRLRITHFSVLPKSSFFIVFGIYLVFSRVTPSLPQRGKQPKGSTP